MLYSDIDHAGQIVDGEEEGKDPLEGGGCIFSLTVLICFWFMPKHTFNMPNKDQQLCIIYFPKDFIISSLRVTP